MDVGSNGLSKSQYIFCSNGPWKMCRWIDGFRIFFFCHHFVKIRCKESRDVFSNTVSLFYLFLHTGAADLAQRLKHALYILSLFCAPNYVIDYNFVQSKNVISLWSPLRHERDKGMRINTCHNLMINHKPNVFVSGLAEVSVHCRRCQGTLKYGWLLPM